LKQVEKKNISEQSSKEQQYSINQASLKSRLRERTLNFLLTPQRRKTIISYDVYVARIFFSSTTEN
jgi:hypothetical protein